MGEPTAEELIWIEAFNRSIDEYKNILAANMRLKKISEPYTLPTPLPNLNAKWKTVLETLERLNNEWHSSEFKWKTLVESNYHSAVYGFFDENDEFAKKYQQYLLFIVQNTYDTEEVQVSLLMIQIMNHLTEQAKLNPQRSNQLRDLQMRLRSSYEKYRQLQDMKPILQNKLKENQEKKK